MSLQLSMYWIPLAMLSGLGARYMHRAGAWGLGLAAVVFWVFCAVIMGGLDTESSAIAVALAAGALAVVVFSMPRIERAVFLKAAGASLVDVPLSGDAPDRGAAANTPSRVDDRTEDVGPIDSIVDVPQRFDRWLSHHRDLADPWPDFGEFVRATLLACCGASQIKAYRLLSPDDNTLIPLHATAPKEIDFPPLRSGIRGYVVTSGKSFYQNDRANDSIHELAGLTGSPCAWCFSIQVQGRLSGVIQVGELEESELAARHRLRLLEGTISLCWNALAEACRSRVANETDSVAGVLTPESFLNKAGRELSASYAKNEPVAVVSFNVEGLRRLTDNGDWDVARDAIRRISDIVRERIRGNDCAGFFDGSRFVVMLVSVDGELASLIARKIQSHIKTMISSLGDPGDQLCVRAGLASSGAGQLALDTLISRSVSILTEARQRGLGLLACTDDTEGETAT